MQGRLSALCFTSDIARHFFLFLFLNCSAVRQSPFGATNVEAGSDSRQNSSHVVKRNNGWLSIIIYFPHTRWRCDINVLTVFHISWVPLNISKKDQCAKISVWECRKGQLFVFQEKERELIFERGAKTRTWRVEATSGLCWLGIKDLNGAG